MANPRRISNTISELPTFSQHLPTILNPQTPNSPPTTLSSLLFFFKRPLAFPFLLTCFLLLTWVSLRLQNPRSLTLSHNQQDHLPDSDDNANLIRFNSETSSQIFKDKRGWLLNPVTAAHQAGISGGARSCSSVHVGQIKPSGVRGNHRHHTCNETLIIWGAKTKFRLENALVSRGYTEVTIDAQEVAVAASPQGQSLGFIQRLVSRSGAKMVKFLKSGKAVIILQGRFAGRKAVIIRSFDDGTRDRPYGHCLVAGIAKYPSKVVRKDSAKKTAKKSRVKVFIKLVNYNHIMPTRYAIDVDLKDVISLETLQSRDKKVTAAKEAKAKFEERFKTGKNRWFFTKLRF